MSDPEPKSEPSVSVAHQEIPNAFSKCANCSISYQGSSNPVESVLLVCLHSFCRNCINNGCLRSDKGDANLVTCCKCKCNSNRADCGINLLADVAYENRNTIKCSSCNDQTCATSRCTVCNDMLCDACVSAHKRVKLTREHPIVTLSSSNAPNGVSHTNSKGSKRYSCAKHSSEKLQLYCDLCHKVTCIKCHDVGGDHFKHPSTDINKAASSFRANLKQQLLNLQEKDKTVAKALAIVNEKMDDITDAETKALAEVREYYNTCMEALRVRMNGLGSEIKKLATSKRAILEKMKDDVGHLQSRLDETSQAVNYAADSGDAIALLSVRKGMSHHMATLLKLKCQVPNPSHKLNIQLQTDPTLVSQVIPQLGSILVDGAPSNQPAAASAQALTQGTLAPPQHPKTPLSNGVVTSQPAATRPRAHASSQPSPLQRASHMNTVHHRALNPSSIQNQHPILFNQVNASPAPRQNYHSMGSHLVNNQSVKSTKSRTPSPATSSHSKTHTSPPLSTAISNERRQLCHPQADAADILRQAAAEAAKSTPISSSSRTTISVDKIHDPLNVNGLNEPTSLKPETPKQDSLKISSVMSLADDKSSNGDKNGRTTPPNDQNLVAKKRKKTALSPFHVSSQHCPDDPNEDYCAVCHNGGELFCCDTCPKVFHATCHVPELTPGAVSSFSCSLCWDEKMPPAAPETMAASKRKAPSGLSDFEVRLCEKILLRMFCHKDSIPFHIPVPKTVKFYHTFIKVPLDFMTISKKLMRQHFNHYDSIKEFVDDMKLVFSNCVAFNGPHSEYTRCAREVQNYFVEQIKKYFPKCAEIAASIYPPEEVMNTQMAKKQRLSTDAPDDPVVHIS